MLERLFPQQADDRLVVEDVFSTTLYSGTGSFRGINVGISNFAVAGGMVWMKSRNSGTFGNEIHRLYDTARAGSGGGGTLVCNPSLQSNSADLNFSGSSVTFYSTGTTITVGGGNPNNSDYNYASWSFRKAPKFFDVVTYTGNGAGDRNIPHNLGIQPGAIIVKSVSQSGDWVFNHRMLGPAPYVGYGTSFLNSAEASTVFLGEGNLGYNGYALCASSSSTTFNIGAGGAGVSNVNASGVTYVAYLFAHDPSADGIIQCGSFANGGSGGATVTLGWEPQWVLFKASDTNDNWRIVDNMRGFANAGASSDARLFPNLSSQEFFSDTANPTATGFVAQGDLQASQTYIYIAIRRGPMRTPTLGTSVFSPATASANGLITTNFPVDLSISRALVSTDTWVVDRLRGGTSTSIRYLFTASSGSEQTSSGFGIGFDNNTAINSNALWASNPAIYWNFRRAPGFMDVVCYTGDGTAGRTVNHNLGVVPELMIVKSRSATSNWRTYNATDGNAKYMNLQDTDGASTDSTNWNNTSPTASVFTVGTNSNVNGSGRTFVAYLFASVPGVSKVGSYTGNGSSQTINCAFTTGARFVLIKRTNAAGDWYVWDSARGIVSGNDPYLALNTTAAEVTSNDSVDPDSTGFIVNQVAASNINVNAATYIFLAIA
jgi:hypothetical protein